MKGISIKEWRALSKEERRKRLNDSHVADALLHANGEKEKRAGIRDETPEYLRLNKEANDKAALLPWHRR